MSTALSVYQAKKSIGARVLFESLSFGLNEGARVGLVGPNGAGKSTLLRVMAGLETLDSGSVTWSKQIKAQYIRQSSDLEPGYDQSVSLREYLQSIARKVEQDSDQGEERERLLGEYLSKADLRAADLEKPYLSLSGGGRKKAQIIRALLAQPNFLLMDEPTNHLDVQGIMWLESFLNQQRELGLILISHDRLFLQNAVDEIIEINPQYREGFFRNRGGYSEYVQARIEKLRSQQATQDKKENQLQREMAWLRRGAIARLKKQMARQNSAADLIEEVDQLRSLNRSRKIELELKSQGRSPKKLIEINESSASVNGQVLFKELNLIIQKNSRIGFLGRNGCGKSTLMKLIIEAAEKSAKSQISEHRTHSAAVQTKGQIYVYEEIKIGFFDQERTQIDLKKSLLENICPQGDYVDVRGAPVYARSYLDRFGFRRDQHHLKVGELSGGEQNRLVLARIMARDSQVLLLDEPTNDLDFDMLATLKDSLAEYEGAIILVTHDRAFMDEVCDEILFFPSVEADFKPIRFSSFLQWQDWVVQSTLGRAEQEVNSPLNNAERSKNVSSKKSQRLGYMEQRELDGIQNAIQKLEEELRVVNAELATPEVASDAKRLIELSDKAHKLESSIEKTFERWQELEAKRNG